MATGFNILGIETSCDETAAAVLRFGDGAPQILGETVRSQVEDHAPYGGVVPEIAARAHAEICDRVVSAAMDKAGLDFPDLSAVAATSGPGLIGGVMVGMMTGKAIALASGIPFLPINHLEGHALSPRLSVTCPFPYLLLLVSGGHCQFIAVEGLGVYHRLGSTIDDAAGEAFDKTAKLLGLGFPGGPAVERCAASGDDSAIPLPRPLLDRPGLDMSFAGLKTAVARAAQAEAMAEARKADLCASFQRAVADVLSEKTRRALGVFAKDRDGPHRLVVAGGVAANATLRAALDDVAQTAHATLIAPPLKYCTDNAAMIALAGAERFAAGLVSPTAMETKARPRWPLDEVAAANDPAYGSGKRGAKA
ncbi:MAG: tRNA (adenosine(37)-N6)-threonylcarbamoyltransferase complex transferase subunit TsaD [Pseudomonadota bacterium]